MQISINKKSIEVKKCSNIINRFLGLMFKNNIKPLYFPHCNSIHTFFMKKNIDIVMTDKNGIIVGVYKNIPKNKIIINKKAYNTYEFPIDLYDFKLNDTIKEKTP